jgi:hypothetical protein
MSCSGEECDGRVIRQRTVGRAKRSEAARIEGSRTEDLTEDTSSRVKPSQAQGQCAGRSEYMRTRLKEELLEFCVAGDSERNLWLRDEFD